jgi:hypothetical protein
MEAELTTHLGYEKHDPAGYGSGNSRNGKSKKKIKGEFGEIDIAVPGIAMRALSRRSCPKARLAPPARMTRFYPCTRGG